MLKIQMNLDQLKERIKKFQTTRQHTHPAARSSSYPLGFGDIKASFSTPPTVPPPTVSPPPRSSLTMGIRRRHFPGLLCFPGVHPSGSHHVDSSQRPRPVNARGQSTPEDRTIHMVIAVEIEQFMVSKTLAD